MDFQFLLDGLADGLQAMTWLEAVAVFFWDCFGILLHAGTYLGISYRDHLHTDLRLDLL